MAFLYHAQPSLMVGGQILYPLSGLKNLQPDLWRTCMDKYTLRPWVEKIVVGKLECGWHDVVFFSAVHPQKLRDAFRKVGRPPSAPMRCYQIPARSLPREKTVVMSGGPHEHTYEWYDPDRVDEYAEVPEYTLNYYRACHLEGRVPLMFHGINQVLYKGVFNVTGLPVVEGR